MKNYILLLCCFLVIACNDDVQIKPNAKLRLEYPAPVYKKVVTDCAYDFDVNQLARVIKTKNWEVLYPKSLGWLLLKRANRPLVFEVLARGYSLGLERLELLAAVGYYPLLWELKR
jgi:hypothetical protein